MIKNVVFALYCLLTTGVAFSQSTPKNWAPKKIENGITIYTRTAENSNLKELKAVFYLKTSLSSVVALVDDWESYSGWVYKCGKSSILKKISETENIHLQTVLVPWPLDNRDFIVTTAITQDEKTKIVTVKSTAIPNYIPVQKGFVRIPLLNASWILTPMKDGTVEIVYQLLVNPGGCIPAWIANLVVIDGPFATMVNFKEWVMKPKYQMAKVSFIKE